MPAARHSRRADLAWTALGAVMALAGAAVIVAIWILLYDRAIPGRDMILVGMGLPGSTLISGSAQVSLLVGLWLVWRANARRREP